VVATENQQRTSALFASLRLHLGRAEQPLDQSGNYFTIGRRMNLGHEHEKNSKKKERRGSGILTQQEESQVFVRTVRLSHLLCLSYTASFSCHFYVSF
jgi:hypothetical protein